MTKYSERAEQIRKIHTDHLFLLSILCVVTIIRLIRLGAEVTGNIDRFEGLLTEALTSMPQFVPVVDDETPAQERRAPGGHKLPGGKSAKGHVDRGWEQGNVGWGVLGSFGSMEKDEAAQGNAFHKSSRDDVKMVKNEKGLWVKVKQKDEAATSSGVRAVGRGRGRGISVIDDALGTSHCNSGGITTGISGPGGSMAAYDPDDYVSASKKRMQAMQDSDKRSSRDRRRRLSRSHSRERDRGDCSRRHRDHDRYHRGPDHRHRSRSRSRDWDRRDRRRRSRSPREKSRSSSRDRCRDRERRRERSQDRQRSRGRSRDRSGGGREEGRSSRDREDRAPQQCDAVVGDDGGDATTEMEFSFTAVQIVERFLEVRLRLRMLL